MLVTLSMLLSGVMAAPANGRFDYDPADETVPAVMIGHELCYDPHVAGSDGASGRGVYLTWLEFEPGRGDRIWIGRRLIENGADGPEWLEVQCITPEPGMYKSPTLTATGSGSFWLTYEQGRDEKWSVQAMRLRAGATPSRLPDTAESYGNAPIGNWVSEKPVVLGPGINHSVAPDHDGGAWVVWQALRDGRFDVMAVHLTGGTIHEPETLGGMEPANHWQPDVAVLPNGDVHVIWDALMADTSFDVFACSRQGGQWSRPQPVSGEKGFEARARAAAGPEGRVWTVWEEGNENWGERYVSRMRKFHQEHLDITDANGPLHAFRKLRFGLLDRSGYGSVGPDFPMPAMKKLAARPDAPEGVEHLGGYYERAEITVDGVGRPWVVYRHYYLPWVGVYKTTHVQQDWGVYARCFDGSQWSRLFRCDIGQGDGMQRLSVTPLEDGIALAYTTGRTDRRPKTSRPGMALACVRMPASMPGQVVPSTSRAPGRSVSQGSPPENTSEYQAYFGDLHRHTDLSLCYVATDGTMDDAYRFAIDVARLDFMAITDHSRDIANNNAESLLWWRCVKEVSRHDLSPNFIPMYAYEHSRGGEDHNVISLTPRLWSDKLPLPQLWQQMDDDSISIPHQTLCRDIPPGGEMPFGLSAKTWGYGDDRRRPLLEIYQGCRDRSIERDAHVGLGKGHIMGFIASSDHISTNASFAGVWSKEKSREAIFRAMQARRTFGATDRITLKVTMGDHWMGEMVPASRVQPIQIEAEGTAAIESLELILNGEVKQTLAIQNLERVSTQMELPPPNGGEIGYFYIRLRQTDGNRAWSSPIWIIEHSG